MKRWVNLFLGVVILVLVLEIFALQHSNKIAVEKAWQDGFRMSMSETGELVEMVYISPRGEKYHRDRQCPQGIGMRIAITEVEGKYSPCKKCMTE